MAFSPNKSMIMDNTHSCIVHGMMQTTTAPLNEANAAYRSLIEFQNFSPADFT